MPFFRPCTCTLQHIAAQILGLPQRLGKRVMQCPGSCRTSRLSEAGVADAVTDFTPGNR